MAADSPERRFEAISSIFSVRRVYGDPIERDGVTVIPAATLIGGGGGGTNASDTPEGEPAQVGAGFGGFSWASGAFEITDGGVRWVSARDPYLLIGALGIALASIIRALRD